MVTDKNGKEIKVGDKITFDGKPFPSVDATIVYAEKKYAGTY